ncbi:unnamed protein product, partial [marine sediment metagenome]
ETLVLDDVAFNAQAQPVTITGTIDPLELGTGWPNTAYVEIGVRPAATMTTRNAGVYLIFFAVGDHYEVHLQDYSGQRPAPEIIKLAKTLAPFAYEIKLTPVTGGKGGIATLTVTDKDNVVYDAGLVPVKYGYVGTWEEGVPGSTDPTESFSNAYLFYSIIADRRGTPNSLYRADIGDITTDIPKVPSTIVGLSAVVDRKFVSIVVNPSTVDFGKIIEGSSASSSVNVVNHGNVLADVTAA